ncbi:hypothetical protein [Mucilaginibacter sp.]|jgi:hypothetical protein|uniref:beta strand repeat-containing protein n=1 Tax=Mucilaginibacter sp. TaxID=1882438 RepID=UPI002CBEEB31|nr:hypothetical protein [Mucilaginibacter sp.]HTI59825.1 hypothetical protein [Mucilaginibacter sp.]
MKILKKPLLIIPLLSLVFVLLGVNTFAQTTYDWVGNASSGSKNDWTNAGNWQSTTGGVTTSPATDYPGHIGSTEGVAVYIGVNITQHGNGQPIITAGTTINIASLDFGDNFVPQSSITGNASTAWSIVLLINGNLNISGAFTQRASSNYNPANISTTGIYERPVFNYISTNTGQPGTMTCGSFIIGDGTLPSVDNIINTTQMKMGNNATGGSLTLNVLGDFILYSPARLDVSNKVVAESLAEFSFAAGTINLYGQIKMIDVSNPIVPYNYAATNYQPLAFFSIDGFSTTTDNPVLNLYNASPLNIQTGDNNNKVDFYNVSNGAIGGTLTVNFKGTDPTQDIPVYLAGNTQQYNFIDRFYTLTNVIATTNSLAGGSGYVDGIYTNVPLTGGSGKGALANITVSGGSVTGFTLNTSGYGGGYAVGNTLSASNANLGGSGSGFSVNVASITGSFTYGGVYGNIVFSGSGTKKVNASTGGTFSVIGDFTIASGTETVDITTNNPNLTIGGNYSSASGTTLFKNNSNALTINGTTSNGGLFTHSGTGGVTFTGTFTNTSTGVYNQSGSGAVTANNVVSNSGTYTQSGSGTAAFNAAFTSTGTGVYNHSGTGTFTALSTTNNAGTFNQSATSLAYFQGAVTNSGTVNLTGSGALTNANTTSNTGLYNSNGAGLLTFSSTATNSGSGSITQNSTGTILFSAVFNNSSAGATFTQTSNGTTTFASDVNNSGTITHGPGAISVAGTYTNNVGGKLILGSGDFTFTGDYTNNGTFTAGTGNALFSSASTQRLKDGSANGTVFNKVTFSGDANKNVQSGHFYVSPSGIMTLSGTSTHVVSNASYNLTLMSDVNGSATVPAIPNSCSVDGPVTVQRYVTASRSYRLVSSPVADTTAAGAAITDSYGNKIYSVNYLRTNTYITGSGGGVDKVGNPTLYLYRENLVPSNATFTGGNFRGISDLSASPNYTLDIDGGPFNIPIGNGYLFYFRGSRKQASLATLTTAGAPATTDTLNAVGALNQGTVNVHYWYTPGSAALMYSTASGNPGIEGFNLVGNPYASSIDWDKFSNSNSAFSIYGPGLSPIIAMLNPTGQTASGNYGYYDPTIPAGTNNATHIVPSGVGFFVQASPSGANTLRFSETAKVNTQVVTPNLFMGKPPVANQPTPYIHLKVAIDSANSDETIIAFNAASKTGYDLMEDARYRASTGKVMLASVSDDNVALAINHLPLSKGIIPLKLTAITGNYTINVKHLSGIPEIYAVWLKDAFTKDSVNLRTTAAYSFNVNTADTTTLGSKRFSIVIGTDPANAYQLLTFTGNQVGNSKHVELDWTTKNEQNYTHFTVERSNDNGKTFEVVGGMLSTGAGAYSLTDKNAINGDNLYRLKHEDITNTITYSNVVNISITGDKGNHDHLTCYPNPAINNISISIPVKTQGKNTYDLRITNSAGIVVKYAVLTDPSWQGSVGHFLTGTYLIQVIDKKNNSVVGQTKFVKL